MNLNFRVAPLSKQSHGEVHMLNLNFCDCCMHDLWINAYNGWISMRNFEKHFKLGIEQKTKHYTVV